MVASHSRNVKARSITEFEGFKSLSAPEADRANSTTFDEIDGS